MDEDTLTSLFVLLHYDPEDTPYHENECNPQE